MLSDDTSEAILNHVARYIGDPAEGLHELIPEELHVDIHKVAPVPSRNYYTLVTTGMCARPMAVPARSPALKYAELMISLPSSWPLTTNRHGWPILWLRLLARMPGEHDTFLAEGHTIPNGDPPEPFGPGTKMSCMLVRKPQTAPEAFRTLRIGKRTINFYGLVPIYENEMHYALENGYEALDALLRQKGVTELLDVKRPSVVSGGRQR
jgi:hypothetical protein